MQFYRYYQDEKDEKRATRVFITLVYVLLLFCLLVFACTAIFEKYYGYVTIRGTSMQPTLNADPIYENGYTYQDCVYIRFTKNVTYGDIIIIERSAESDRSSTIIKRVLGFEGDKITIAMLPFEQDDGSLRMEYRFIRIKDEPNAKVEILQEDYLSGQIGDYYKDGYLQWSYSPRVLDSSTGQVIYYEEEFYNQFLADGNVTVEQVQHENYTYFMKFFEIGSDKSESEPDQIFYMGDNRTGSTDARFNGTASVDRIVGKVMSIAHNAYSAKNSPWYWLYMVKGYLELAWKEIVNYFSIIA